MKKLFPNTFEKQHTVVVYWVNVEWMSSEKTKKEAEQFPSKLSFLAYLMLFEE